MIEDFLEACKTNDLQVVKDILENNREIISPFIYTSGFKYALCNSYLEMMMLILNS